jgi:hypothetical protein
MLDTMSIYIDTTWQHDLDNITNMKGFPKLRVLKREHGLIEEQRTDALV